MDAAKSDILAEPNQLQQQDAWRKLGRIYYIKGMFMLNT